MAENDAPKVGGLLLAAGGSSRFGAPKQLAIFEGKTLIARAAEALLNAGCYPVVAVLGANAGIVGTALDGSPLIIEVNSAWQDGMSTSIAAGLNKLLETEPDLDAVMITLSDQPFVTQHTIKQFLLKYSGGRKSIISSRYDGALGVPALFGNERFNELNQLTGDKGARHIIRNTPLEMIDILDVGEAVIDVDTAADLHRLIDHPNSH